jgi:hypothetical protein
MNDTPTDDPIKPLVVGMIKAEALLDCSHDQIYDLIRSGELQSYLEGHRRKITMASIEALIAKRLAAAGSFQRATNSPPRPPTGRRLRRARQAESNAA